MADQDLDVMRRWADAWNRSDLEAFADTFDPDAELITDPSWMEAGPFRGRAAIKAWYEGLTESWDGRDAVVLKELFEANENVIARIDWQVRGRSSGIDTELDATSINTIRRGRIARQQWYFDHTEALAAVGLA
jgi:ketosteroid isomerase-like protein